MGTEHWLVFCLLVALWLWAAGSLSLLRRVSKRSLQGEGKEMPNVLKRWVDSDAKEKGRKEVPFSLVLWLLLFFRAIYPWIGDTHGRALLKMLCCVRWKERTQNDTECRSMHALSEGLRYMKSRWDGSLHRTTQPYKRIWTTVEQGCQEAHMAANTRSIALCPALIRLSDLMVMRLANLTIHRQMWN